MYMIIIIINVYVCVCVDICKILYAYIHRHFYLKDREQFYLYYMCNIFLYLLLHKKYLA